jgi:sec-independent protein translocase protein TatA
MLGNLNGWHLVIILVVILLLFGATRLPALSKSVAQSMRIFRSETKAMKDDDAKADPTLADGTGTAATGTSTSTPTASTDAKP